MSNLPVSEQYRLAALRWNAADGAARMLEECRSAVLSQMMMKLGEIPVTKAEMLAKGSPEWDEYNRSMVKSREKANELKIEAEFLKMKFWEQQGHEASKRAEMRL